MSYHNDGLNEADAERVIVSGTNNISYNYGYPTTRPEFAGTIHIDYKNPVAAFAASRAKEQALYKRFLGFWYRKSNELAISKMFKSTVNELVVETDFVSMDQSGALGVKSSKPFVYETFVTDASGDNTVIERYTSYWSAIYGHYRLVKFCKKYVFDNMVECLLVEDIYGFSM